VREQIIHCFVPTDFQAAPPGPLDGFVRRGDHEEVADEPGEARNELPALGVMIAGMLGLVCVTRGMTEVSAM
jgi:hypothetical protein